MNNNQQNYALNYNLKKFKQFLIGLKYQKYLK